MLATLVEERTEMKVTAAATVRDRLSLASEKIEAGCDAAACMAEVAGAIGARVVLFSRFSQAGSMKLLRLEAFDEHEQRGVSVVTIRAESVGDLYEELPKAVNDLVARSDGFIPPRQSASPVVDAPGFFDRPGNTFLVVGPVIAVAGGALLGAYFLVAAAGNAADDKLLAATKAYEEDPRQKTARAVVAAHDDVTAQRAVRRGRGLRLVLVQRRDLRLTLTRAGRRGGARRRGRRGRRLATRAPACPAGSA
jgi:hypothetical protein